MGIVAYFSLFFFFFLATPHMSLAPLAGIPEASVKYKWNVSTDSQTGN